MKITSETLKWPQIRAAFSYLLDNNFKYEVDPNKECPHLLGVVEFGAGRGGSLARILEHIVDNKLNLYVMGYDSWKGLPKEAEGISLFKKFKEGAFNFLGAVEDPAESIRGKLGNPSNLFLRQSTFDKIPDGDASLINKAVIVHIDCDLYISAYQALDWLFKNKLIALHTLIAYDEYWSTDDYENSGECKAHQEIMLKYNCVTEEIFHYMYADKNTNQRIRQSIFEVKSVQ